MFWLLVPLVLLLGVAFMWQRSRRTAPATPSTARTLLYFCGPHCAACATAKLHLAELMREAPWLQLREIDATTQPRQARHWGIMTVPTVILLTDAGETVYRASGALSPRRLQQAITTHSPRSSP